LEGNQGSPQGLDQSSFLHCNKHMAERFSPLSSEFFLTKSGFSAADGRIEKSFQSLISQLRSGLLLQRGIADLLCDAAALPGRFLPELGRSAPRSGHFSSAVARCPVD